MARVDPRVHDRPANRLSPHVEYTPRRIRFDGGQRVVETRFRTPIFIHCVERKVILPVHRLDTLQQFHDNRGQLFVGFEQSLQPRSPFDCLFRYKAATVFLGKTRQQSDDAP